MIAEFSDDPKLGQASKRKREETSEKVEEPEERKKDKKEPKTDILVCISKVDFFYN